jgi:hypothetical protein
MLPLSIPNSAIACGSVSPPGPKRIDGSTSESKRNCIGEVRRSFLLTIERYRSSFSRSVQCDLEEGASR